jgi:hypothetical protein
VAPDGRVWVVRSEDDLGTDNPVPVREVPAGAIRANVLLTLEEMAEHVRRVEKEGA